MNKENENTELSPAEQSWVDKLNAYHNTKMDKLGEIVADILKEPLFPQEETKKPFTNK
jgi:hypothetical protein